MAYLIGTIAKEVPTKEEKLAIWYNFLWDRTRAVRKVRTYIPAGRERERLV